MKKEIILDSTTKTKITNTYSDTHCSTTIETNPDEFKSKPELLKTINTIKDEKYILFDKLESSNYRFMISVVINIGLVFFIFFNTP